MNTVKSQPQRSAKGILKTLENHQADLQRMGVCRIGLFGSYRRGAPSPESDMDFLVALEKPTFDSYMDVKFFLEDLFGCRVDLVMEETIKPRLRPFILQEVIYVPGL
ncbi:MAG: nucleotidyltransferase family protein [Anaerolineales bacterium]|nr:nucleotidyltransferase family protein [Anaerolineales bacterium]